MTCDPRIDAYIANSAEFARPILAALRSTVHVACPEVAETIRWSMPSFSYRDRPLASMAAFKQHCKFGVWDAAAMATGKERDAMGRLERIESVADLPAAALVETAIRDVMAMIDGGERPPRAPRAPKPEAEVPPALAAALSGDAVAAATFTAFSASCRREYCEWIGEAKRAATRDKRVAEAVDMLRAGKRRNWKYETC